MFACLHAPGMAASGCAYAFSPLVEEIDADTVVLAAAGLEGLFGAPAKVAASMAQHAGELGMDARVAIAANPDAAIHAARGFTGTTVIARGEEAARLSGLPVEILFPTPELLTTLDCWGIRTFGDLAGLPELGIAERLGEEGVRLQKLARGAANRTLHPGIAEQIFEEVMELEYPIEELEPFSFVLSQLLHRLLARLQAKALSAIEIRIQCKLENRPGEYARAIRLPVPMRDHRIFLKLLQLDLNSHPPDAPIVAVRLAAEPARSRAVQSGLFTPPAPEPEKLELTLARISAVVGEGNVGSPQLLDTHRPDAFRIAGFVSRKPAASRLRAGSRFLALRRFRPPRPAKVQAPSGNPVLIAARGVHGKVLSVAGPWRSSGDWWTANRWARQEWDVSLSDGALYRIFCDLATSRWFVEGSYD